MKLLQQVRLKKLKSYFRRCYGLRGSHVGAVVGIVVAVIGVYALTLSHAASPYVSNSAANGTVASGATINTSCTGSQSGSCVYFGSTAPVSGCGLSQVAFCDSFSEGPSSGGRSGQLNPALWSVSRYVGNQSSTDLMPFPSTPVGACQSGKTTTSSDNDILVCDSSSGHQGQIETAMSAQNYALLSMRPRQPFDFAGRTGTISYNVDAATEGGLSWWTSLYVTQTPDAGDSNESQVTGITPQNGIGINFDNACGTNGAVIGEVGGVYVYNNYTETEISNTLPAPSCTTTPTSTCTGACITTSRGHLNHIEVKLSQTSVSVYGTNYSTNGQTFPSQVLLFSAPISLNFNRGYVHFQEAERAPAKYEPLGFGIDQPYTNNYWSDLGFDGPVINTGEVGYSVPDALTPDPDSGSSEVNTLGAPNIGYSLLNNPISISTCCRASGQQSSVGPFSIPNVKLSGVASAKLTFLVAYTYANTLSLSNVALQYSINGGPWLNPSPEPNYAAEDACASSCPGPSGGGGVLYDFPIPLSDLVNGTNTLSFSVPNGWNSFPPILSSVDLLTFTGNTPP